MYIRMLLSLIVLTSLLQAQDKDAYSTESSRASGLFLDPSRLSIQNSVSFGAMSGGGTSNLQSQSLYSTLMRYQFTAPVTLNLNFSLPIHSSFSSMQNLTSANLQSMDYFKSIPFEMSLAWQPTKNTLFQFSVVKPGSYGLMGDGYQSMYRPWRNESFSPEPLSR